MPMFKDILILLAILLLYGIVGRMDYDDAVRHEALMRASPFENGVGVHATAAQRAAAKAAVVDDPSAPAEALRERATPPF